jgi:hypothetical protein
MVLGRINPAKRLAKAGCGCLLIIIILIILGIVFSGQILKKLISGAITQKTGVVIQNLPSGSGLTYTDPKTGATLNINNNKVPDNFPKDFPVYPGSNITSSWTANNFELTLTTQDSLDKVSSYYKNKLEENGWKQELTTANSWVVSKGKLTGFLSITTDKEKTSVIIILGDASTSTP